MRIIKNNINAVLISIGIVVISSCGGGGGSADDVKNALGLNCNFSQIEGSSVESQTITSGNTLTVSCDEDGYHGGGSWYCQYDGNFDGKSCEKNSYTASSYALEGFHCDLDEDGVVDEGEDIDFPDHSFVSKWRVTGGDLDIELPVVEDERLDFYVDWGDGKCSRVNNNNFDKRLHSYASADDYQVRIIGTVISWGGANSSSNYRNKLIEVIELGDVAWENLKNAFSNLPNLTSFKAIFTNTSLVTDMASMFQNSDGLSVFDISGITTQLVEDMSYMFSGLALSELDLDHFISPKLVNMEGMFSDMVNLVTLKISGLITKNVTTMENLFYGCTSLVTVNFGDYFETSSVTTMANMFRGTKIVNLDLSFFDTSNVTDMSYMFEGMSELTSINWGTKFITTKVINMEGMFSNVVKLTTLDLSLFSTALVTNMANMFSGTTLLSGITFGDYFDTSKVTTMYRMFFGSGVTELNLSGFNTGSVINMAEMFGDTVNLINIIFGNYFVTNNVTNMYYMFGGSGVTSLDLSTWDVSAVTNMEKMFYNTVNLINLYFGNYWTTGNVINMYLMFANSGVTTLNLSAFNTSSVTNMGAMFQGTSDLAAINFGTNFTTGSVTNIASMFDSSGVAELDLSAWDTTGITDMSSLFQDTASLTSLTLGGDFSTADVVNFSHFLDGSGVSSFDFSSLNTGSATDMSFMLANMTNQTNFDLTGFDTADVTTMESMLENLGSVSTLDISSFDTSNVLNFTDFLGATTLDNASSVNLGDQTNTDIIPGGYDLSSLTVERICSADLASIHSENSSEPANAYFSGTVMTLSSTDGAVTIKCTDASKGLSQDVTVSCDQETGEIVSSSPDADSLSNFCE